MNIKNIIASCAVIFPVLLLMPAIPGEAAEKATAPAVYVSASRGLTLNRDEFLLLARLIHAEARGEPLEGQVAVGSVVFNRLQDPRFPKTVTGVIYEINQFTPVQDGSIELSPNEQALLAAELALNGLDPTNGCKFFYNPAKCDNRWFENQPFAVKIGNHIFC